jgi:hypothetical protein
MTEDEYSEDDYSEDDAHEDNDSGEDIDDDGTVRKRRGRRIIRINQYWLHRPKLARKGRSKNSKVFIKG